MRIRPILVVSSSISLIAIVALGSAGCRRRNGSGPIANVPIAAPAVPEQLVASGAGQALTRVTSDPIDEFRPALSPDGSSLLFVAITYEVVNGQRTTNVAQQLIIGVNPNGGSSRTMYTSTKSHAGSPSWMPDNSGFVFVSNSMGQWNVVRTMSKAPNAAISVVTRGDMAPGLDRAVTSPDGKRVAFQMTVSKNQFVGVSGIDGSSFTQLTEGFWPSWSPDGKQLAFVRQVGQHQQIFIANSTTGDSLVQVTNDDANNTNPSWSPDARYLVFQSNRGFNKFAHGSAEHTWNLFAIKPDGTTLTQLTDGARDSGQPFWGSDGWIYFTSNDGGNYDIWRLKTSGELAPTSPAPSAAPAAGSPKAAPVR